MPNQEPNELSERELDILKLVATGASNKEIAQKLFISSNTVKVHLRNIFTKIGANSRTEAAMYAVRAGLSETVAPQVSETIDDTALAGNQSGAYPGSAATKNRPLARYLGLSGVLLLILIVGFLYLRKKDILASTTPPTPTPRVQWFELPGMPIPRSGLAVASYDNKMYAIAGEDAQGVSNSVESFDPQTSLWSDHAAKPTPVADIEAAVMGGLIYVPGGRLASGAPTDELQIYDPQADKWTSASPMPQALSAYALAVFEGRMYLFGGWDGARVVNNAYVYDPRDDSWSVLPPMPTARSFAGAVVSGGKIYVIGGWDGTQALAVNEALLPEDSGAKSTWTQAPSLPYGRYGMGITNLADIIFIVGGLGSSDNPATIALSSGETNWGQLESPVEKDWAFLGATTIGTRLYVLGGKKGDALSSDMWSYQAIFTITLPIVR